MIYIKDEIFMLEKEIKKLENELNLMDPNNPDNRFKYPSKISELNILKRKLEKLKEEQGIKTKDSFRILNQQENAQTNKLIKAKVIPVKRINIH